MNINIAVTLTLPQDAEKLKIISNCLAGGPVQATVVEVPAAAAPAPTPEPEPKTRKPRAAKAEAAAPAPTPTPTPAPAPAPAAPAAPAPANLAEMTEEQSLAKVKAVAKLYVQRFANQVDGIVAFRQLMSKTTGVGKLDDLVHAQRLQVIVAAEKEIATAGPTASAPAAAAKTGVEV